MPKKLSSFVPRKRWITNQKQPPRKSFSIPKDMNNKKHPQVQRNETIVEVCNNSQLYNDFDSDWMTSNEEAMDFLEDIEYLSDKIEHSSIEVARSACTFYPGQSLDDLVVKESVMLEGIWTDSNKFFSCNQPIASSTPIKKPAASINISKVFSYSDENVPVTSSTPKLSQRNVMKHDEMRKCKLFEYFCEESPIKEEPVISYKMPSEKINQDVISDIEDHLQETILGTSIPDISGISECKDVIKFANENCSVSAEEVVNATCEKQSFLGTKKRRASVLGEDFNIEKTESNSVKKRFKNIPVCCLALHSLPEFNKSKTVKTTKRNKKKDDLCNEEKSAERCLHATTSGLNKRCQKFSKFTPSRTQFFIKDHLKKTSNVSICCLGTLECVLPTLNMAVPSISVKNALRVLNRKN